MRALDLYCGAGGATKGLQMAGFHVTGIDINRQPRYCGDAFIQADALQPPVRLADFDFIWASPPCQAHTAMQHIHKNRQAHPDLIGATRAILTGSGVPWVIENVGGSPLRVDLRLCGTMFGLPIIKHRFFEANFPLPLLVESCNHRGVYDPWHGPGRSAGKLREAQGTPWIPMAGGASRKNGVTGDVFNAIPPAYAEYIGRAALQHLMRAAA